MTLSSAGQFWNDPEMVRQFADRQPDVRLVALLDSIDDPQNHPVLDIGCAGGRNSELLAARGFPVQAIDFAIGMVERTRERVARYVGAEVAAGSVRQCQMHELDFLGDGSIRIVVALGILQQARDMAEWAATLDGIGRVTAAGGKCLVANFAPGTGPVEAPPPRLLPGTSFVYENKRFGSWCLPDAKQLDAEFSARGFFPDAPTELVDKVVEEQRRCTVNALYRKGK
ncbi:MAG: class I SAM-dependent methyltransferase [Candidatus Eisenbacteria bacterium]